MGPISFHTVVIPSGQSVSSTVRLNHGEVLIGLIMPSGWDSAVIGFQVTRDGTNFHNVKGSPYGGTYGFISQAVDPNSYVVIDPVLTRGLRWFRLRSMTALGADVNQTANRTIVIVSARTLR
jgi:hypothetical protein